MDTTANPLPAQTLDAPSVSYQLPDGRVVRVQRDVCRTASVIGFTLANGRVVDAVICANKH